MSDAAEATEKKGGKKGLVIMILVAVIAIGGGAGGTWFFMQGQQDEGHEPPPPKEIPTTFKELELFTVNLQPKELNQYLQVGLTVKIHETEELAAEVDKKMPEIRNRILLLLTNKTAEDLSTLIGKKQLGSELVEEIKESMDSETLGEGVLEVLFTSMVIQ